MMQDKSHGKEDTWEFVDRRITDVMAVGATLNSSSGILSSIGGGLASIVQGVVVPPTKDHSGFKK